MEDEEDRILWPFRSPEMGLFVYYPIQILLERISSSFEVVNVILNAIKDNKRNF